MDSLEASTSEVRPPEASEIEAKTKLTDLKDAEKSETKGSLEASTSALSPLETSEITPEANNKIQKSKDSDVKLNNNMDSQEAGTSEIIPPEASKIDPKITGTVKDLEGQPSINNISDKVPEASKVKDKLKRPIKKLSIEELNKPFPGHRRRRRSSIPKVSQEESSGTDPSLFICHKGAFQTLNNDDDDAGEVIISDPIESDIEDTEVSSPSEMVVSEGTIMFFENTPASTSEEVVEPIALDDSLEFSEPSEDAFDIIIEAVDVTTGETIETPRVSGSSDIIELLDEGVIDNDENDDVFKKASVASSNAGIEEPRKKLSHRSQFDDHELSTIHEQASFDAKDEDLPKFLETKDENIPKTVEPEPEVADRPPRPPSITKKLSRQNLDDQQPSTSAEVILQPEVLRPPTPPAKTAPPLPPPLKPPRQLPLPEDSPEIPKVRCLQSLTIWPQQFRPLPGLLVSPESRVSLQVKLDDEEFSQTIAVNGNPAIIFSEKIIIELKKPFQVLKLFFIEHMENCETRLIGQVKMSAKNLSPISGKDLALPVQGSPSIRSSVSTVLGEVCVHVEPKEDENDTVIVR